MYAERLIYVRANVIQDGDATIQRSIPLLSCVSFETIRTFILLIETKDSRTLRFGFDNRGDLCQQFAARAAERVFGCDHDAVFAFSHLIACPAADNGWSLFDMTQELQRMGLPCAAWRISNLNADYSVCPTYPAVVAVPTSVMDAVVRTCATYRSRGRFPILSYLRGSVSITRAAQPQRGLLDRKCAEDELVLSAIAASNSNQLVIVDARAQVAAVANTVMGAGYEGAGYARVEFLKYANVAALFHCLLLLMGRDYVCACYMRFRC